MKHHKARCPVCGGEFAVSVDGSLRKHPRGAPEHCTGSGHVVEAPMGEPVREQIANGVAFARAAGASLGDAVSEMAATVGPPRRLAPGIYRSGEPMLESGTPIPDGHVAISLIAYYPYDGSNGRAPYEEAALLFEDPAYFQQVLSAIPNEHARIVMKVPPRAKPVYSDTTSPASDPGATTGATP